MYPKILLFIFLIPFSIFAQKEKSKDTIRIKMEPAISTRVVLYGAEGARQKYVNYVDAASGDFKLAVPKDLPEGMYRLVYNQKTMEYLDFLYSGSDLEFEFNPTDEIVIPKFKKTNSNTTYFSKLQEFGVLQAQLDSLQVVYFQTKDISKKKTLSKSYTLVYSNLNLKLDTFLKNEKNTLVTDLIKANIQVKPKLPIENPVDYLPFIKEHYFDNLDFNNKNLSRSSILIDKVMDYVFYLTVSEDADMQNKLHKKAIANVLNRVDDLQLKKGFIQALVQSFAKDELFVVADYLFTEFYDKLPLDMQNSTYKAGIQQELKTAIGRVAPSFTWTEGKENTVQSLSSQKDYDNYVIVFWSTTCPHCLKEMPKLYDYIKDNKKVKVILIGLQTENDKGDWKSETYYYPEFSHVLALGKWENNIVRSYNVHATPSYYVLDADKKIIGKPFEFVDVKDFFSKLSHNVANKE